MTGRLDLFLTVISIHHQITPDGGWTVTLGTTRTTGNRPVLSWDASPYSWDDTDPANEWSH